MSNYKEQLECTCYYIGKVNPKYKYHARRLKPGCSLHDKSWIWEMSE